METLVRTCGALLAPVALILAFGIGTAPAFAHGEAPEPETHPQSPKLVIDLPFEGQVVPGNEQLSIAARFEPPIDLSREGVDATVEVIGPDGTPMVVATGDVRRLLMPDSIATVWDASSVPPGPYRLRIRAKAAHIEAEADLAFVVQPPPEVDLYLTALRAAPDGGVAATFEAVATSPAGTPITDYVFSSGNGDDDQVSTEGQFVAVYRLGSAVAVSVEARDALGATNVIGRDLHVPHDWYLDVPYEVQDRPHGPLVPGVHDPVLHPVPQEIVLKVANDCGCRDMTIDAGRVIDVDGRISRSRVYCAPTLPGQPGVVPFRIRNRLVSLGCQARRLVAPGTCAANQAAFDCPLGQRAPTAVPASNRLGWGFDVFARLDPNTNDQNQCTQGQYARGDFRENGFLDGLNPAIQPSPPAGPVTLPRDAGAALSFNATAPPARVPFRAGPDIGADDYAVPGFLKQHTSRFFYWYDQPSQIVRPVAANANNDLEFISFVRGNTLGTCWCRFVIDQRFTAGGKADGKNTFAVIDGNRCIAGDGVIDGRIQ